MNSYIIGLVGLLLALWAPRVVWVHTHIDKTYTITLQWPFIGRRAYRGMPGRWMTLKWSWRGKQLRPWATTRVVLNRVHRSRNG
jgi:hypothetical protein